MWKVATDGGRCGLRIRAMVTLRLPMRVFPAGRRWFRAAGAAARLHVDGLSGLRIAILKTWGETPPAGTHRREVLKGSGRIARPQGCGDTRRLSEVGAWKVWRGSQTAMDLAASLL